MFSKLLDFLVAYWHFYETHHDNTYIANKTWRRTEAAAHPTPRVTNGYVITMCLLEMLIGYQTFEHWSRNVTELLEMSVIY